MNPNDTSPAANTPLPNNSNPLSNGQSGGRVICEVHRHPIGMLSIYAATGMVVVVTVLAAIFTPIYATFLTSQQRMLVVLGLALVLLLTAIFAYIGVYIYKANRWIVTNESVTQIEQIGLFNREVSQLSLASLEDVSAHQDGLLQTFLGYGDLVVESAGEGGKFVFQYCPNPNDYARKILAAHEEYDMNRPGEMVAARRPLNTVQQYGQQGDTTER